MRNRDIQSEHLAEACNKMEILSGILICFIFIVGYLLLQTSQENKIKIWLPVILLSFIILIPFFVELIEDKFDILNLKNIFIFFIFLQFVIWPLSAATGMYENFPYYAFPVTILESRIRYFILGEYFVIAGVLAFYFGYYVLAGRKGINFTKFGESIWNKNQLIIIALLNLAVSIAAFNSLMTIGGGFINFISNIDAFRNENLSGVGYLIFITGSFELSAIVLVCYSLSENRLKIFAYTMLALSVVLSLLAGARHNAIAAVAGMIIMRHYLIRPIRFNLKFALAIALILVANAIYVLFRKFGLSISDSLGVGDDWYSRIMVFPRFIGAESLARIIDRTGQTGFQGGLYIMSDIIFGWIPRALWVAKPLSSGIIANTLFFPEAFVVDDTGSAPPTLIGELYWTSGLPGIIIGMIVMGILLKKIYNMVVNKPSNINLCIYSLFYMFAFFANETLSLHLFRLLSQMIVTSVIFSIVNKKFTFAKHHF